VLSTKVLSTTILSAKELWTKVLSTEVWSSKVIQSSIQKEAKRQGKRVALIRDRLYIENELYVPAEEIDEAGDFDINRSMIIKSNTTFFIYTIVINDSKVFINKTESLKYLGLFSLTPLFHFFTCTYFLLVSKI
jgi:hypothetical protein